jgi:hypothetical protein
MGGAAGDGGAPMGGESGGGGDYGGEGGAPSEACLGDSGISDCAEFGLPTQECFDDVYANPVIVSCHSSAGALRPGALEAFANCLVAIPDGPCTTEAEIKTYACGEEVASRACPAPEAVAACQSGIALEGGGNVPSPLVSCDDGTLTQESCTELLNAVKPAELPAVVECADPTGEYADTFSGTCAERLHHCVFPTFWIYT